MFSSEGEGIACEVGSGRPVNGDEGDSAARSNKSGESWRGLAAVAFGDGGALLASRLLVSALLGAAAVLLELVSDRDADDLRGVDANEHVPISGEGLEQDLLALWDYQLTQPLDCCAAHRYRLRF